EVWRMILSFQGYSFCTPHSASYALVSFKACYLRAHFPAEFMAAVISNQGGYYTTMAYLSEARRMGLTILPPDVNTSALPYVGYGSNLRVGLMQLKGVREASREALLEDRARRGPFGSLEEILGRVDLDPADLRVLIKAGCLDSIARGRSRPELLWELLAWEAKGRGVRGQGSGVRGQDLGFRGQGSGVRDQGSERQRRSVIPANAGIQGRSKGGGGQTPKKYPPSLLRHL
ncbi:MAG: helix-hairpin-helix domain-containing protein, partial [Thermodesulfobacteriota bacterium]